MKRFFTYVLLISASFLFNCSSDDDNNPSSETNLSDIIRMITDNGNPKTWKIENATLTNSNTQNLDISNTFNIKDDEFIFSTNSSNSALILEHRQRHGFNKDAESFQEFLLEHYKSSLNYTLNPHANTNNQFSDANDAVNFVYDNSVINGEWLLDDSTKLTFTLTEKTPSDYQTVPESLNFEDVITIPSEFAFYEVESSSDVISSQSNNSIFIVYNNNLFVNPNGGSPTAENVLKYNIDSNQFTHSVFHNADFYTKRAHIVNNELNVVGAQFLNTYNLNLDSDPAINPYNDGATIDLTFYHNIARYDAINYDDTIYVLSGNLSNETTQSDYVEDKIFTLNASSPHLSEIAQMPGPKSKAASELVDNTIYTFSGQRNFLEEESAETTCYKYNISDNSFSTFNLPTALNATYSTSVDNLIFVAGQVFNLNTNNDVVDINAYFGVYNTLDNTFTEVSHNLDDSDTSSRIHGITYINNELYVVYGNNNSANEGVTKILKASL